MIVAADTNILLDVLGQSAFAESSWAALRAVRASGSVVVCEVVLAEVAAQFAEVAGLERFLETTNIETVATSVAACHEAGLRWRKYARGRGNPRRDRIIADFMVGAHALHHANALHSRDLGVYRTCFADLKLLP